MDRRASRLAPASRGVALSQEAQRKVKDTVGLLRLASSVSAPVLLDPATVRRQPVTTLKASPRAALPPLPNIPAGILATQLPAKPPLPPATAEATVPAAASALATSHGTSFACLPLSSSSAEPEVADDPLDDATDALLFRVCFWPLYVWHRETTKSRALGHQVTTRLNDGMSRARSFRRWRAVAVATRHLRENEQMIGKRVRASTLIRYVGRLNIVSKRDKKCNDAINSPTFRRLRVSRFCRSPFLAIYCYATCRALVRRRCTGELICRREGLVAPFPIPPPWHTDPIVQAIVSKAVRNDLNYRKVARHLRRKLAPVLFDYLHMNVELQRRKRYCLLRGFKLIYGRVLSQWALYVLLGIGRDEEKAAVARTTTLEPKRASAGGDEDEEDEGAGSSPAAAIDVGDDSSAPRAASRAGTPSGGLASGGQARKPTPSSHSRRSKEGPAAADIVRAARTYGAYLLQRHGTPSAPPGQKMSDQPFANVPDAAIAAAASAAEAITMAHKAKGLSGRRSTVVDMRVAAKLEVRRKRLEETALRRKGGGGGGIGGDDGGDDGGESGGQHHLDLQALPGAERTQIYTKRLAARLEQVSGEFHAVEARGGRLRRRADQQAKRVELQESMMDSLEKESSAALTEDGERTRTLLTTATSALELLLAQKVENLVRVYRKVAAAHEEDYTFALGKRCLQALKEPLRWKRAVSLRNKWRIRRWLRICVRLRNIDASIHRYHRVRTLYKCFWGWLYQTGDALRLMTPGIAQKLKRRRQQMVLYSSLLEAERSDSCPRCLFARWLEYTHRKVTRRAIVSCSKARIDSRLMASVFHALHSAKTAGTHRSEGTGVATAGSAAAGDEDDGAVWYKYSEARWSGELERWVCQVLRPESFADWNRRKNRWTKRRQKRLIKMSEMRQGLIAFQSQIKARVEHEANLHYEVQNRDAEAGRMPNAYLTGALSLREYELQNLWVGCAAVAKAVHHSEKADTPRWAEPLRPYWIALALARWMFNALSHGLPKLPGQAGGKVQQPSTPPESAAYQKHFSFLLAESERRTTQ